MASFLSIAMIVSLYISGVITQHEHVHPENVRSETFGIVVQLNTPGKTIPTISWNITKEDRDANPNVGVIAKALNVWAHSMTEPGKFVGHGFQGLVIHHHQNGKHIHTFNLPKCTKPRLGEAIIKMTSGDVLSKANKDTLVKAIAACENTKTTAT